MPENYEVVYTHPGGATATFIRHDGELDALAKALDAEQFWVFKNVKALLVRNDPGDLEEATRLMRAIGFAEHVRVITTPVPVAAVREPVVVAAPAVEAHAGPHLPGPSYWPLALAASATIALGGFLVFQTTIAIVAIGLALVFICIVGFGLQPI
ncbi:MAG TPA: hypothetical protein VGS80_15565 [Ktedonobacterales bacterium]|nr:hypothetical protein [Ktedonobacterales bacterium]